MLLKDYGKIIIIGLCNSPNHLKEHFEREVLRLSEKHYGRKEVEDKLRQVLEMHKARIKEIYEKDMTRYKEYSEQDKSLPPHEKYFYPCPELNEISLTHLDFPSAGSNIFPDGRKYTLVDFANVEAALNEVFGIQQTEAKTEQETIEIKPVLKPEAVQMVFDILKDFFSPEHQIEFRKLIETGNNVNNKLLFKGNGNRLNDTFKKLIEHDFITGCQKQDLINWIISNFTYIHQNKMKVFIYDTVEKVISRNDYPCKSPLIEIKSGQIQKVEQTRKRKQRKY